MNNRIAGRQVDIGKVNGYTLPQSCYFCKVQSFGFISVHIDFCFT